MLESQTMTAVPVAVLLTLAVLVAALLVFMLIYCGYRRNVAKYLSNEERPSFEYNGKIFKKCFLAAVVSWAVCFLAAAVCSSFTSRFVRFNTLYSSSDKEEFKRFVQTVNLDGYEIEGLPQGDYYFELSTEFLDSDDDGRKIIELSDGFYLYRSNYFFSDGIRRYLTSVYWQDYLIIDEVCYFEEAEAFLLRYGNFQPYSLAVRVNKGTYSVGTETNFSKPVISCVYFLQACAAPVAIAVYFTKRKK